MKTISQTMRRPVYAIGASSGAPGEERRSERIENAAGDGEHEQARAERRRRRIVGALDGDEHEPPDRDVQPARRSGL